MEGNTSIEKLLEGQDFIDKLKDLQKESYKLLMSRIKDLENIQDQLKNVLNELNEKNNAIALLKDSIERDKAHIDELRKQIDDLKAEQAEFKSNIERLNKAIEEKENLVQLKDRKLDEKDQIIKNKDQIISEKEKEIEQVKEKLEQNQSKIQELQSQVINLQNNNEDLKLKKKDLEEQIKEINDKYDSIKKRLRDSGDSVLGQTMELEKMKEQISEKDARIKELENKLGSILSGKTGVFTTKDKIKELFQEKMQEINRSIRLCLPHLNYLEDFGLLPIIQDYSSAIVINIASNIKPTDEHIVLDLKSRGINLTQYNEADRWLLNKDGEEFIIAIEKDGDNIIGFYTNETKLVSIFNSVIMEPWIKGIKL
ncbi:MAG: hypothetical protein ACTSWN_03900 [Promethearchaeota archaeon]